MPQRNHISPIRGGEGQGGSRPQGRFESQTQPRHDAAQRHDAGSPQASEGQESWGGRLQERGGEMMHGSAQMLSQYPLTSILAGFGLGLGLGVLLTAVLAPRRETWADRYGINDAWDRMSSGVQRLPSMITEHIPDALRKGR